MNTSNCTILLLNYNESSFNYETLNWYLKEELFSNFKFLLADDGSKDKKLLKLKKLCEDNGIDFVTGKNLGTLGNIIRALNSVETKYVIFQGGTDRIYLETVNEILGAKCLIKEEIAIFSKLKKLTFDINNNLLNEELVTPKCTGIRTLDNILLPKFNLATSLGAILPTTTLKKVLRSLPSKERYMMEDWILNYLMGKEGLRLIQTDFVVGLYRQYEIKKGITLQRANLELEMAKTRLLFNTFGSKSNKIKEMTISWFQNKMFGYIYWLSEHNFISKIHVRIWL